MEDLVLLFEATQDGDGVLHARLTHEHLLETAGERGVLLDVLTILVERSCADGVQVAAGERRLQDVARVHRAFRSTRTHDGVELVDEQNDATLGLLDLLEHRLQAVLELATVLGTRNERTHVKLDEVAVAQGRGHVARDDALGDALDDGGLAHAGLADEHGVVLGTAGKDLNGAADLLSAADDRVELARAARSQMLRPYCSRASNSVFESAEVTRSSPRSSV